MKGVAVEKVLTDCFQDGMYRVLDIGTEPDDLATRRQVVTGHTGVLMSAGCYPAIAATSEFHTAIRSLTDTIRDNRDTCPIVAIGEFGLDYHWMYGTKELQETLCTAQIRIANELALPVILHVRDAHEDMLSLLQRNTPSRGGVVHCFSGTVADAKRYTDLGLLISFSGSITFKSAAALRECAATVPFTAILAETDSPYLSPVPLRGKPNDPSRVAAVYEALAYARKTTVQEIIEVLKQNFTQLFGNR